MSVSARPLSVVLAGGGTAGHVEPALAVADHLRSDSALTRITLVGTASGLETRLVPARGHRLALIPRVPFPRKVTLDLLRLPWRLSRAIRTAEQILDREEAAVVVGFGGYVALPVYLAARRRRVPVIVHEANARAGIANRIGARFAVAVAVAHPDCGLRGGRYVGIPLREEISGLDRWASRADGRRLYGLEPDGPVLLVSGGSSGARRLNRAIQMAADVLADSGIQVLHHAGLTHLDDVAAAVADIPTHHVVGYIDRMDLAYAAADLMVCRAGAMTCAELAAVGLPAVYVPLPIGNGEQRLNALPVVRLGGGILVDDTAFDGDYVERQVVPLLTDAGRLSAMTAAARIEGRADAAREMVALIRRVAARDVTGDTSKMDP